MPNWKHKPHQRQNFLLMPYLSQLPGGIGMRMMRTHSGTVWSYILRGIIASIILMALSYAVPLVMLSGDCSEGNVRFCLWFIFIFCAAPVLCIGLSLALYFCHRKRSQTR